jgi:repressor of nif and glnA expression
MKERGKNISDRKTRYKLLKDNLTEKTGYSQLKGEELDQTLSKTHI